MAETDLYAPIKTFLEGQGYVVKGEVRDCDIVAIRAAEDPVIVELKLTFSLQLLLQGIDRQSLTDAVYLAFRPPKRRQQADIVKLCRRLGLGLLVVTGNFVEPWLDPAPYQPRRNTRRKAMLLKEFAHRVGDPNTGGSTRRRLMTAYRQDALRCAAVLSRLGPSKVALIRAEAGVARALGIVSDDVYGWFMRVKRGVYDLSPKGQAALVTFSDVVQAL